MNPTSDHRQAPEPADPTGTPPLLPTDAWSRRRAATLAGHAGDTSLAAGLLADPDPTVRVAAVGAMARLGFATRADVVALAGDTDALVRRRVAEELGRAPRGGSDRIETTGPVEVLRRLVGDPDPLVAETAAWALGARCAPDPHDGDDTGEGAGTHSFAPDPVVVTLAAVASGHPDALVREAAVAALGAIGDPDGLEAVLAGTSDRPAIRRRAVLALAAFWGQPGVDDAVARAASDRDWQVRDAARLVGGDTQDPGGS
jgi:HEAT repeat protein